MEYCFAEWYNVPAVVAAVVVVFFLPRPALLYIVVVFVWNVLLLKLRILPPVPIEKGIHGAKDQQGRSGIHRVKEP